MFFRTTTTTSIQTFNTLSEGRGRRQIRLLETSHLNNLNRSIPSSRIRSRSVITAHISESGGSVFRHSIYNGNQFESKENENKTKHSFVHNKAIPIFLASLFEKHVWKRLYEFLTAKRPGRDQCQ